jgi:hypothetical protein
LRAERQELQAAVDDLAKRGEKCQIVDKARLCAKVDKSGDFGDYLVLKGSERFQSIAIF